MSAARCLAATLPRSGARRRAAWAGWRWPLCAALVLGLHAALLLRLTRLSAPEVVEPPEPPAILVDLSEVPPAPAMAAARPLPLPIQAPPPMPDTPTPADLPTLPPIPLAEAQLPPPPLRRLPAPRKPVSPRPPLPRPVPRAASRPAEPAVEAAASSQPSPAVAPAATATAAAPARPNAIPNWQGELVARLRRARAYPDEARMRGDSGTTLVSFAMDRAGHVLSVQVVRSSGLPSLDEAAMQTVHRAEPLPELPPEIPGPRYTVSVPISFTLH